MKLLRKNKTYHLTINHWPLNLTPTLSPRPGYCCKCHLAKEIHLISERPIGLAWEERKLCWSCALNDLYELEVGDYQLENKKEVIKELRKALLGQTPPGQESGELLEYYA